MSSAADRVSGSGKEKKKLRLLYHVSGEGFRRNAFVALSHGGYNIYGLEDLGVAALRRKP
jgi:hypothetical protein